MTEAAATTEPTTEPIPETRPDGKPMSPSERAALVGEREQAKLEAELAAQAPAEAEPEKPAKAKPAKAPKTPQEAAEAEGEAKPAADEKRDRAELVAKLAAARKAIAERDELARKHAEATRALEDMRTAREREAAELRDLLRTNPREALKRGLGADYNELTKAMLNAGKPDPTDEVRRELQALKAAQEAEREQRAKAEAEAARTRDASVTEQIFTAIDSTARAGGERYELLAWEISQAPDQWRGLFRQYVESNPDKTADQACAEFEAALFAREQKRATLGKIKALADAKSAKPAASATNSGTQAREDGPRTLTAGMAADRPTSAQRNKALSPYEERKELEERLRRAARLVR